MTQTERMLVMFPAAILGLGWLFALPLFVAWVYIHHFWRRQR